VGGIIENTQKKILHLRREQFNDIYTEFKHLCELFWGMIKGEMSRFVVPLPVLTQYRLTLKRLLIGYRDPARAVALHNHISEFPSEMPTPRPPKTIEILTKAVRDVLLTFLDGVTAFGNYDGSDPRERSVGRKGNEMMMKVYF
jgi:hypothetical protein